MFKPKLIIIHGMGQHTADSFKEEFVEGCRSAFSLYDAFRGTSPEHFVEIIPVTYSDLVDDYRLPVATSTGSFREAIESIPEIRTQLLPGAEAAFSALEKDDSNTPLLKTHGLDAFLYRYTRLGQIARERLGRAIAHAARTIHGGVQNVHVLAHSLGTAVLHDTLSQLYTPPPTLADLGNLDTSHHKLGSVHMVANISRLMESSIKVNQSLVKPSNSGCMYNYREYRHRYDPITWAKPFNPKNDGRWISSGDWQFIAYKLLEFDEVTDEYGNTHKLHNYLNNPLVHRELFKLAFGIEFDEEQTAQGDDRYFCQTRNQITEYLQAAFSDLRNLNSIDGMIHAAAELKGFVEQRGGQFHL
ncbi:hypothetical protein [Microbulbifer sp. ARAS458-1]|uniref:hypothetical protein n=1 Tax=Microbulbifer sp. ARAS458-1 TaxID=3140242 RepID=UPI0038783D61